jgi:hypothetical protein
VAARDVTYGSANLGVTGRSFRNFLHALAALMKYLRREIPAPFVRPFSAYLNLISRTPTRRSESIPT